MISHRFDSTVLCGRCGEPVGVGADGFAVPHFVPDAGVPCRRKPAPSGEAARRLDTPSESEKSRTGATEAVFTTEPRL